MLIAVAAAAAVAPTMLATPPAHAAGGRRVALLLAPSQLSIPQVELTGDVRLGANTSVAGIVGLNFQDVVTLHHFGGQFRQTFSGNWSRGAFLGAEVVTGDDSWLHEDSSGLTFGGFVGGRYTFAPAFTLDAAIGGRLWWVNQGLHPGALVNLGLGWSF
ncbi:MAG: hypothetical protein GXP62_01035 [Oligoflexia bacterium]|nr:hypothetical protein [Oligoflexia bacterium]